MGRDESPASGSDERITPALPDLATLPVRPRRQQSEVTIRLEQDSRERTTLAAMRASLPPLDPITDERPILRSEASAPNTPHTIVLPTTTRIDHATLTMLRGSSVGTTFRLEREETVLGRGSKADIVLDELSVSREHARITLDSDGEYSIEDLGSTNGTFVGGRPIRSARLMSGDRVQVGSEYTFRFALLDEEEETLQRKLYESSTHDALTGLMNRGCLFENLARAIERTRRDGSDLAVLILDVDHFKSVNDRFGHAAGDEVLKAVSIAAKRALGEGDLVARYGGEEFAILARPTSRTDVEELAERVREEIAALRVEVGGGAVGVTVSIGAARLSECEIADGLELFTRADMRLYTAKIRGRDRICAYESE